MPANVESRICDLCYGEYPSDQMTEVGGQKLCPSCLATRTVVCRECGERILSEDNAGTDTQPLCQDCYDEHFTTCTHCGTLLRLSRAYYHSSDEHEETPYCGFCFSALRQDGINNYYYKPAPIFYGEDSRYFGVELEIDGAGEDSSKANHLLRLANRSEDLIYCKRDGSLEDGFEIVTHPMSLDFHRNVMPWADLMAEAISMGYTSHQAYTCGLHIHVNRNAFGTTEAIQDACIARILYFFEKNWEELLKFSRRTQRQLNQWAARYGYKDQPQDILDHVKKGGGKGRYNNHPFLGKTGRTVFALAHNGVIHNDRMLRRSLKLPRTKIETDSFIAVQLIQQKNTLDFGSLKYMAEQVEGSFSFTVLDDRDHLYFVKGDSPLCICHYPDLGLYLYASTAEILMDALTHIPHYLGEREQVHIDGGELLLIGPNGGQERASFRFVDPMSYYGFGYWGWDCCRQRTHRNTQDDYTRALKSVAGAFGISPGQIDQLLDEGFTREEIEDCLYCGDL